MPLLDKNIGFRLATLNSPHCTSRHQIVCPFDPFVLSISGWYICSQAGWSSGPLVSYSVYSAELFYTTEMHTSALEGTFSHKSLLEELGAMRLVQNLCLCEEGEVELAHCSEQLWTGGRKLWSLNCTVVLHGRYQNTRSVKSLKRQTDFEESWSKDPNNYHLKLFLLK